MLRHIDFIVYCIEEYAKQKGMNGRVAFNNLMQSKAVNYIDDSYEALHTYGDNSIVMSIDEFLSYRGAVGN